MGILTYLRSNKKGQSLVELALILPLLLLVVMGVIEFGRIFGGYLIISNASRDGARYGSVGYDDEKIIEEVLEDVSALNRSNITIIITPEESGRRRGEEVTVLINYRLTIIAPIISEFIPGPLNLETSTTMRVE